MLPTYRVYLSDWSKHAEVYGKVINWDGMCKLNNFCGYTHRRGTHCFILAATQPEDSTLFPYAELQANLHKYSHIPELTSDQVDQLIFIHSLDH